jgi:hypothetical protein
LVLEKLKFQRKEKKISPSSFTVERNLFLLHPTSRLPLQFLLIFLIQLSFDPLCISDILSKVIENVRDPLRAELGSSISGFLLADQLFLDAGFP